MTEHTTAPATPTADDIRQLLATTLKNTRDLKGTHEARADVMMDAFGSAGLSIVHTATIPHVTITESLNQATVCTVTMNGVVKFAGSDFSASQLADGPTVPKAAYDAAGDEIARLMREIEGLQTQVQTLTEKCQQKNSDCERYAQAERDAAQARRTAENKLGEHRNRWAPYALAIKRLEHVPDSVQAIPEAKIVMMTNDQYGEVQRDQRVAIGERQQAEMELAEARGKLDQLRDENTGLRAEMGKLERGEKIRQLIALIADLGPGSVIIDGVRIEPVGEI